MKLRVFPDMHEAFNTFCVAFKDALQHFTKCTTVYWRSCLISSRSSCRSHLQIKGVCTFVNNLFIFISVIFISLSVCLRIYLSVCMSVQTYCMFTLWQLVLEACHIVMILPVLMLKLHSVFTFYERVILL